MTETVPIVSLQRTLRLLLIVYASCMCTALLAGAALVAHVDPFSECLLYSYAEKENLYFGEEAYCETIGYLYLACIVGAMVLFYLTMKHLRIVSSLYKTGQLLRGNDALMKLNKRNMWLHLLGAGLIGLLTIALTTGYASACDNIRDVVSSELDQKQQSGSDFRERVDEKFQYDDTFWRYNAKINNIYGTFSTIRRLNCRAIFTDPHIHQKLHETHIQKYASYFGYWYKQDLNNFDPSSQAVLTNALIEASLAGGWLSVLLWGGSFIFMVVQRFYLKKEKREMDKVSLHGNMDGTLRKEEMSIISGYQPSFQRGGLRGSDRSLRSMKSQASRREVDDLAFAVHGINTPTPRFTSSYPNGTLNGSSMGMMPPQPYPGQPYPGQGYPGGPGFIPPAPQHGYIPPLPQQGFQYPMPGQNVYNPNGSMHSTPRTPRAFQRQIPIPQISVEDTDKSQVETEIM